MAKRIARKQATTKPVTPTGIDEIDRLASLSPCTIQDYVKGVSVYVQRGGTLEAGPKKSAQIRLSNALARSLAGEIVKHLPYLKDRLVTEEQNVAGGLRIAKADVSESHKLDGLRLAVELKPINLAVGRAIWNRFGDVRTFAVNIHLKFPFAVVGAVLVIPTYEETGTKAAQEAEAKEEEKEHAAADGSEPDGSVSAVELNASPAATAPSKKSTVHLIDRAIERLVRAGGRKSEAESDHLLEGIAVVVYDPDTGTIHQDLPKAESGLRWEQFISALVAAYRARFED